MLAPSFHAGVTAVCVTYVRRVPAVRCEMSPQSNSVARLIYSARQGFYLLAESTRTDAHNFKITVSIPNCVCLLLPVGRLSEPVSFFSRTHLTS